MTRFLKEITGKRLSSLGGANKNNYVEVLIGSDLGFSWAYSAKTVHPPQKLMNKGCRLAPEMIPITQNCAI